MRVLGYLREQIAEEMATQERQVYEDMTAKQRAYNQQIGGSAVLGNSFADMVAKS